MFHFDQPYSVGGVPLLTSGFCGLSVGGAEAAGKRGGQEEGGRSQIPVPWVPYYFHLLNVGFKENLPLLESVYVGLNGDQTKDTPSACFLTVSNAYDICIS